MSIDVQCDYDKLTSIQVITQEHAKYWVAIEVLGLLQKTMYI
jgi:hypothetical protein